MKKAIVEIWGWYGAGALLLAFTLSSFGIVSSGNVWYQLLNLTGASGIVAVSIFNKAYPPAVLNAIWALVACVALVSVFLK